MFSFTHISYKIYIHCLFHTYLTNGNCHSRQVPDGDIGANGTQLCDYTGKSGQYTPKFTASIGFDYFTDISFLGFEYFRTTFGDRCSKWPAKRRFSSQKWWKWRILSCTKHIIIKDYLRVNKIYFTLWISVKDIKLHLRPLRFRQTGFIGFF